MRILGKFILAAALTALLVDAAFAQPPGGGRGRGNPLAFLLDNKDLQKELKLTQEQVDKAKAATEEVWKKHADELEKLRDASPEDRQATMTKISKEGMTALESVFQADQTKRLKEIMLQQSVRMRGPGAFLDEDVKKTLKLSDEQSDKIKTIAADTRKEIEAMFQSGAQRGPETFQKVGAMNKEAVEKIESMLSADQKKAFKDLQGEPFEIRFGRPGGQ
jgi:hypothetical protein